MLHRVSAATSTNLHVLGHVHTAKFPGAYNSSRTVKVLSSAAIELMLEKQKDARFQIASLVPVM